LNLVHFKSKVGSNRAYKPVKQIQAQGFIMKKQLLLALALMMVNAPALAQSDAVSLAKQRDASIDRGFIMSHAETLNEGELTLNSYELFLAGMSYGVTDNLELTLTTLLPIIKDMPIVLAPQVKWVFLRGDQQVMSAKLNVTFATMTNGDSGSGGTISGGLSHDFYFDREGRYAMFSGLDIGGVFGNVDEEWKMGKGLIMAANLGFSAQVADFMKVMVEGVVPAIYADNQFEVSDVVNFTYGMRFFGEDLAVDLGFIRPLGGEMADSGLLMGLPYVAFTARL
jgi:hypothetical protein